MTGWLADVLRIFAEDDRANPAEKKTPPGLAETRLG
jgi:hypothetical protein